MRVSKYLGSSLLGSPSVFHWSPKTHTIGKKKKNLTQRTRTRTHTHTHTHAHTHARASTHARTHTHKHPLGMKEDSIIVYYLYVVVYSSIWISMFVRFKL